MNAGDIPQFYAARPDDAFRAPSPPGANETFGAAFALHRSDLQAMVLERAQADVALSIASATASRVVQSLSTILGMQV